MKTEIHQSNEVARVFNSCGAYIIESEIDPSTLRDSGRFFIQFHNGEQKSTIGPLSKDEAQSAVLSLFFA